MFHAAASSLDNGGLGGRASTQSSCSRGFGRHGPDLGGLALRAFTQLDDIHT